MAGLIPPECYKDNEYTYKVNVIGTKNLIDASKELNLSPKIIYTSSIVVYGDRLDNSMIKNDDPPNPNDIYGLTKLNTEKLIKKSRFEYLILRLSYCASIRTLKMNPVLFLMPLNTNIEIIHTKDVAIANAIYNQNVWNKSFLLGGGKECRIKFKTHINDILEILGFGRNFLPENAFEKNGFNCGFCQTKKVQEELDFQQHTLKDFYDEIREWMGIKRYFVPLVKYFVKKYLLRKLRKHTFLEKEKRIEGYNKFKKIIECKKTEEMETIIE
jgi:nucleoside-diphosphate-sugar epimerase